MQVSIGQNNNCHMKMKMKMKILISNLYLNIGEERDYYGLLKGVSFVGLLHVLLLNLSLFDAMLNIFVVLQFHA